MIVEILGKRWRLVFCRFRDESQLGDCDPPDAKKKQIRISKEIRGEQKLNTIIHEIGHATAWHVSEEHISKSADSLSAILWKLGLRWTDEE